MGLEQTHKSLDDANDGLNIYHKNGLILEAVLTLITRQTQEFITDHPTTEDLVNLAKAASIVVKARNQNRRGLENAMIRKGRI